MSDAICSGGVISMSDLIAAINSKQDESEKGQANGYAALGADGIVPASQLPGWLQYITVTQAVNLDNVHAVTDKIDTTAITSVTFNSDGSITIVTP